MKSHWKHSICLFLSLGFFLFAACAQKEKPPKLLAISGKAQLGPIENATVDIYLLTPAGLKGPLLVSTTTSGAGSYVIAMPEVVANVSLLIEVSGGRYVEEATGNWVSLTGNTLRTVVTNPVNNRIASVTALTHIAAERAINAARSGQVLSEAVNNANFAIAKAAGLDTVTDITTVVPADPDVSLSSQGYKEDSVESKYALFLSGISQRARAVGVSSAELSVAFAEDFLADGKLDGVGKKGTITLPTNSPLPTGSWNALASDQADYINTHPALGFSANTISLPNPEPKLVFDSKITVEEPPPYFTVTGSASSAMVVDPLISGFYRVTVKANSSDYRGTVKFTLTANGTSQLYNNVYPVGSGTPNPVSAFSYTFTEYDKGTKSFDVDFASPGTHVFTFFDTSYSLFEGNLSVPVSVGPPYSFEVVPDSVWGTTDECQHLTTKLVDYGGNTATAMGNLQFSTSTEIKDDSFHTIPGATATYYTSLSECQAGTNPKTTLAIGSGALGSTLNFWTKTSTAGYSYVTLDVTSDSYGSIATSGYTNSQVIIYVQAPTP